MRVVSGPATAAEISNGVVHDEHGRSVGRAGKMDATDGHRRAARRDPDQRLSRAHGGPGDRVFARGTVELHFHQAPDSRVPCTGPGSALRDVPAAPQCFARYRRASADARDVYAERVAGVQMHAGNGQTGVVFDRPAHRTEAGYRGFDQVERLRRRDRVPGPREHVHHVDRAFRGTGGRLVGRRHGTRYRRVVGRRDVRARPAGGGHDDFVAKFRYGPVVGDRDRYRRAAGPRRVQRFRGSDHHVFTPHPRDAEQRVAGVRAARTVLRVRGPVPIARTPFLPVRQRIAVKQHAVQATGRVRVRDAAVIRKIIVVLVIEFQFDFVEDD